MILSHPPETRLDRSLCQHTLLTGCARPSARTRRRKRGILVNPADSVLARAAFHWQKTKRLAAALEAKASMAGEDKVADDTEDVEAVKMGSEKSLAARPFARGRNLIFISVSTALCERTLRSS